VSCDVVAGTTSFIDQSVDCCTPEREPRVNNKRPLASERGDRRGYCFSSNGVVGGGGGCVEDGGSPGVSCDRCGGSDVSLDACPSESLDKSHNVDRPIYRRNSEDENNLKTDYVFNDTDRKCDYRELGYLADSELVLVACHLNTNKSAKMKRRHRRTKNIKNSAIYEDEFSSSMRSRPFSLPILGNGLGLYRILQGCVISSAMPVIYCHVVCSFLICLTQIYAVFGVFGVLSNEKIASPWPWYAFQTVTR